jgi:hypothetical protein
MLGVLTSIDQANAFCLGQMVETLGQFGADAAPCLDKLKAIDVSRDERWLKGVPGIIKSIEAKEVEK